MPKIGRCLGTHALTGRLRNDLDNLTDYHADGMVQGSTRTQNSIQKETTSNRTKKKKEQKTQLGNLKSSKSFRVRKKLAKKWSQRTRVDRTTLGHRTRLPPWRPTINKKHTCTVLTHQRLAVRGDVGDQGVQHHPPPFGVPPASGSPPETCSCTSWRMHAAGFELKFSA